jgi:D-alanyl-D-alanine carboxypeptidase
MKVTELYDLAERTRSMREIGIGLILLSVILTGLLFLPGAAHLASRSPQVATSTVSTAFADVQIQAKAAIVYDLVTEETLFEKNADAQLPLASLTKLLTVYAALSTLAPSTPVTIPDEAVQLEYPRIFNAGQSFSLSDLARLTLTASLNDGAAAIAQAAALQQNVSQAQMLASAATALNLSQTYAVNGSGLDVNTAISGGYGSASDLAKLAGALVREAPAIATATTEPTAHAISFGGTSYSVSNTDPIIGSIPRLLLSKTGYTDLAGGNLAIVFDAGIQHPIAIVVLGSSKEARFTDSSALILATLAHFADVSAR